MTEESKEKGKGEQVQTEDIALMKSKGKLNRSFMFWCLAPAGKQSSFSQSLAMLGQAFDTVSAFWQTYSFIKRAGDLPPDWAICLFQSDVKPLWEDEGNRDGGSFQVKVHRTYGNKVWEDFVLSFIGEQCSENDEICGIFARAKEKYVRFEIWTKELDENAKYTLSQWIHHLLAIDDSFEIAYQHHPKGGGRRNIDGPKYIKKDDRPRNPKGLQGK
jgi:translation initiation factor 4E